MAAWVTMGFQKGDNGDGVSGAHDAFADGQHQCNQHCHPGQLSERGLPCCCGSPWHPHSRSAATCIKQVAGAFNARMKVYLKRNPIADECSLYHMHLIHNADLL